MMRKPGRALHIFTGLYLAGLMGLFTVLLVPQTGTGIEGKSTAFIATWIAVYLASVLLLVRYPVVLRSADWPIVIFLGLVALSASWSGAPQASLQYAMSLLANFFFALIAARHIPVAKLLSILLATIIAMAIGGYLLNRLGMASTTYLDVHDRFNFLGGQPIRGLFNHKITAGFYAGFGLVGTLVLLRGAWRIGIAAFLLFFIALTGSSAALAVLAFGLVLLAWMGLARSLRFSPGVFLLATFTVITAGALVVWLCLPDLLALLNRDPTLTGRTQLWTWGLAVGSEKPIFGWGFFGYFGTELAAAQARSIAAFQSWDVPHFHNSYIETFAELGIVGLAFAVFLPLAALAGHYRSWLATGSSNEKLICVLLLMTLGAAGIMHVFFKYNDLPTFLLMFAYLSRRPRVYGARSIPSKRFATPVLRPAS
jgi:O-antigen ligase